MTHPNSSQPLDEANDAFRRGFPGQAVALLSKHAAASVAAHSRLREYLLAERKFERLADLLGKNSDPGTLAIDQAVHSHLGRDFQQAIALCNRVLVADPGNVYAMNHLARALFNTGKKALAESTLVEGLALKPDFAEMHNNLGHVRRDKDDLAGAVQSFQRALELMPAFVDALMNMGTSMLAQARPAEALDYFGKVIDIDPGHPDTRVNMGSSLHMLKRYDEARRAYQASIDATPGHALLARRQLGKLLIETGETDAAIEVQKEAVRLHRSSPDLHAELASTLEIANRIGEAWEVLSAGLAAFPDHSVLLYEKAKLQRRKGDVEGALTTIRSVNPAHIPPYLRQWLFFELGTLLDRSAEYSEAYRAFTTSNGIARQGMRARMTDTAAFDRALDAMSAWVSRGAPMPPAEAGEDLGEDLCFLLGFPRSGTTLLDVMLDGHPDLVCLEERQTMEHVFHLVDSAHHGFPGGLSTLDRVQRAAVRLHYRERLKEFGISGAGPLVIDKMPIRTPYLGFILRLFPKAKVLFSLRHPCDVVLSNFMQNYAANEVFIHFYSLEESARIYAKVMDIWTRTAAVVGRGAVHYVRYEELIADPGSVLRGVCDYLGIPYSEGITDHRRNLDARDRIRTNSYHQVAEPIYRRSEGRWKNYRPQMDAVIGQLQPTISHFGYEA